MTYVSVRSDQSASPAAQVIERVFRTEVRGDLFALDINVARARHQLSDFQLEAQVREATKDCQAEVAALLEQCNKIHRQTKAREAPAPAQGGSSKKAKGARAADGGA